MTHFHTVAILLVCAAALASNLLGQDPPKMVGVPDLTGRTVHLGTVVLRDMGLNLGTVVGRPSSHSDRTVLTQSPTPGTLVLPGTAVNVEIAIPIQSWTPMILFGGLLVLVLLAALRRNSTKKSLGRSRSKGL